MSGSPSGHANARVVAVGEKFMMLHTCQHENCIKNGKFTCALCDDSGPPPDAGLFDPALHMRVCHSCGLPENALGNGDQN